LLVLVWHCVASPLNADGHAATSWLRGALALTWSGVDLFFVLSGFLIGGVLMDARAASNYFSVFYARRTARIFPLYFAWLALFLVASACAPSAGTSALDALFDHPMSLVSYATFTQNFAMARAATFGAGWLGITWSLAIEEQFYLLLPLVVRFVAPRRLPYLLVPAIVAAVGIRVALLHTLSQPAIAIYVLLPCRADALLLGVLSAVVVRRGGAPPDLRIECTALAVLAIGSVLLLVSFSSPISPIMVSVGYTWIALTYACVLLVAWRGGSGVVARVLRLGWLRRLGAISFGVYVVHQAVSGVGFALVLHRPPSLARASDLLVTLGALVVTLVVAKLSYVFAERPILTAAHRAFVYDVASR
jgi:peptidoglycan/LPS O-acetylase OafA/YrhL